MHQLIMLVYVKMPTIVDILRFISTMNTTSASFKGRKAFNFQRFNFNEQLEILVHEKKMIILGPVFGRTRSQLSMLFF